MAERHFTPQGAVNFAGNLAKETVENFRRNSERLLRDVDFGEWDVEVRAYVRGLRDCVAGALNWLYETERYFGNAGEDVRASGWAFVGS